MNSIHNTFRSRSGNASPLVIGLIVLAVFVGLILISGGYVVGKFNRVQTLDESVDAAWAQVETGLQRRYDLIPNLVNTVKGFADQESEVLTEVTRLRSQWGEAKTTTQRTGIASALEGALGRLMVVSERYPELKSNQNFLTLQSQLEGTENRLSVERRRYNEALQAYNSYVRKFPQTFFAEPRDEYFEAASSAAVAPTVEF